jgi:hypothetical protein
MTNGHHYSNGENRGKSRFIYYRKESIRQRVAIKEPKRCYATISLRQKLKVGRACICTDVNKGYKMP